METLTLHRKRLAGFSLVEMAIVLLIVGIMMSSGLSLLTVKMNAANVEATQKRQEAIKQALINYLGQKKRLPCPGNINGAELTRSATPPTCQNYSGIVPYQELGLDRSVALDGWENFITYVVSPTPNPTTTPPFNAWLYTYGTTASSQVTTDPSLAFWPSNSSGAINVTGTSAINGVVVALISYGKNGYGAINVKGGTNAPPPAPNTDEIKNASPLTVPAQPAVVKRDTTDSTAGGGPFDDIVMILSVNDLIWPLVANGTLQSSVQASLSQANDAVIGNIIASRKLVTVVCVPPPALPSSPAPQPASYSTCDGTPGATYSYVYYSLPYSCSTPPTPRPPFPNPPSDCVSAGFYTNSSMSEVWPAVASASGITYTVATQFLCPYSPPLPSPGCTAGEYYYAINSVGNQTPPVLYGTPSVKMNGVAYQLTAGDGTTKIVFIQELQGILARAAGFN